MLKAKDTKDPVDANIYDLGMYVSTLYLQRGKLADLCQTVDYSGFVTLFLYLS